MAKTHEFEVEGIRFELSHLSVDDACAGLETLSNTLAPAFAKLQGIEDTAERERTLILAVAGQARNAAVLLKVFAPACKVSRSNDGMYAGGDRMVALKPFLNEAFEGRVDLVMAFLVEAVQFEYGAFLGALTGVRGATPTATKPD